MDKICKKSRVNVIVRDKETGEVLFEDHNLFVISGRQFLAQLVRGVLSGFGVEYYTCDLAEGSSIPEHEDIDISFDPSTTVSAVRSASYPIELSGEPTGVHFRFSYENYEIPARSVVIRELGLFYRPDAGAFFPARDPDDSEGTRGIMLARLKTTLNSIVVSEGKALTIDWKIIF